MAVPTLTDNYDIYEYCFDDLIKTKWHGFGVKRLSINIPNTISERIPCRGFGYKDKTGQLFVGLRLYWDQGDYVKFYRYNPREQMTKMFSKLVNSFERQFKNTHKFG